MDEEYEVDTLLDIILTIPTPIRKEYAGQWIGLPVCPFRHANPAQNQPTPPRCAVRLLQHVHETRLGHPWNTLNWYPIPSSIGTNWGNAIVNNANTKEYAKNFALAIDEKNTDSLTLKAFGYH